MTSSRLLRIGLVGSGDWARANHAPLLARTARRRDDVEFTGVWARNPEKARTVAEAHGVPVFGAVEELLDGCDAVDFAVPPHVQAPLAIRAARADKHLMLEKPIAGTIDEARELAEVADRAGVATLVGFTRRFAPSTRAFMQRVRDLTEGASTAHLQGTFLHGGLLADGFLTERGTWRSGPEGALFDLGAHLVDLALAALGPAAAVTARSTPGDALTTIDVVHRSGALSQLAVSMSVAVDPARHELHLHTDRGVADWTMDGIDGDAAWDAAMDEFLAAAHGGTPVTVGVREGLRVQALLDAASRSLGAGGAAASVRATP